MHKKILILGEVIPGVQLQGREISGSVLPAPEKISGLSHVLYGQGLERAAFFRERGMEPCLCIAAGDDLNGKLLDTLLREEEIAYSLKRIASEETGSALLYGDKPVCIFPGSVCPHVPEGPLPDAVILEAENLDQAQTDAFLTFFGRIREKGGFCMVDLGEISGRWALDYSKKLIAASDLVCFTVSEETDENEWITVDSPFVYREPSGSWIYRTRTEKKYIGQHTLAVCEAFYALLTDQVMEEAKEENSKVFERKEEDLWDILVPSAYGVASSLEEACRMEKEERIEGYTLMISVGFRDPGPLQGFLQKELKPDEMKTEPGGLLTVSGSGVNMKNRIALLLSDREEIRYYDLSVHRL